uniref:Uncharacterized protein n=1 Tax=Anopheles atroparvus TaxID=41427 RepID=A0A182J2J5_ANOAO
MVRGRTEPPVSYQCEDYRLITSTWTGVIPLVFNPTPVMIQNFNCSNVVQLITGGEGAKDGEFPHHALLGYRKNDSKPGYDFKCGSTLISDLHVMTAAHCFELQEPELVRLGEYDTKFKSEEEHDVGIAAILKHNEYKNGLPYHDIALVKLAKRLMFTSFIRPACLWDTEHRNVTKYIATGFGANETGSEILSTIMRKVQLEEFPEEECAKAFKYSTEFCEGIQPGQLCAGSDVGDRDTCVGDSGGPLQTVTNTQTCMYHVVGITSWGNAACGVGKVRAVYTKVSYYLNWIEDNVWGPNAL